MKKGLVGLAIVLFMIIMLATCAFAADTNCGKCPKCEIVFTSFYAMGKLERFSEVIDVEKFKENMDGHLESIAQGANTLYKGEVYEYLNILCQT